VGKICRRREMVPGKIESFSLRRNLHSPQSQGQRRVSGNVGGVNWGSAAYDPQNHLMFANTNRLIAWIKLIPRAEYDAQSKTDQDNRVYGEFGEQKGAAFGLYRTFLFSPGATPCNAPPWGTTAAVDLFTGKIIWNVPLGSFAPGQPTGTINLADHWSLPADWSLPAPPWTTSSVHLTQQTERNFGNLHFPQAVKPHL